MSNCNLCSHACNILWKERLKKRGKKLIFLKFINKKIINFIKKILKLFFKAIEFLVMAGKKEEAFIIAQAIDQM
jgi:predicted nucleic acid-binding Zn ribbon protein